MRIFLFLFPSFGIETMTRFQTKIERMQLYFRLSTGNKRAFTSQSPVCFLRFHNYLIFFLLWRVFFDIEFSLLKHNL